MKPFTDAKPVGEPMPDALFHSIVDDHDGLTYALKDPFSDEILFRVVFRDAISYRAADEGVLLAYWQGEMPDKAYAVWEVFSSEYIRWLEEVSCGANLEEDGIRHFIVPTENQCLEVLSLREPEITMVPANDETDGS